jgi:hypothetical protein
MDSYVDIKDPEKHTLSIFGSEVIFRVNFRASSLKMETVCFSETMVGTVCTTKIKRLKLSKSHTGSDVTVQLASKFQLFVIPLYLSTCGFFIPSINYNDSCQTSVKT